MTDNRQRMDPYHLNGLLYLKYNRHMWDIHTIEECLQQVPFEEEKVQDFGDDGDDDEPDRELENDEDPGADNAQNAEEDQNGSFEDLNSDEH